MKAHKIKSSDGLPLTYYVVGQGPEDLVVVNAPGMSVKFWLPAIEALAVRFRVIAFEYRGYPECTEELSVEQTQFDRFLSDLSQILADARVGAAHFTSWCAGAVLACAYIRRHPERVLSFTAVSTSLGESGAPISPFLALVNELRDTVDEDPAAIDRVVMLLRNIGVVPDHDFFKFITNVNGRSAVLEIVDLLETESNLSNLAFFLIDKPAGLRTYFRILDAFIPVGPKETRDMAVPTRLINGTRDAIIPTKDGRYTAKDGSLGEVDLVLVPEASHFILLEHPDTVARHIMSHADRHRTRQKTEKAPALSAAIEVQS